VFCLPSSYEGFGIPYAEAMAAGTPVLATPNPGSRYVTDEGRAGVLADDDDLGPALLRLLTDEGARARYAGLGRERAHSFTLEAVTSAYEALYRDVIRSRSGAS
jgi:glycosyltransferase involved in cell wall biosynthesis